MVNFDRISLSFLLSFNWSGEIYLSNKPNQMIRSLMKGLNRNREYHLYRSGAYLARTSFLYSDTKDDEWNHVKIIRTFITYSLSGLLRPIVYLIMAGLAVHPAGDTTVCSSYPGIKDATCTSGGGSATSTSTCFVNSCTTGFVRLSLNI